MDFSKLEEINLTRDELNRFGEALKDEKFRELLNEYAAEISNPENKRRYEEEITQLEKDRGTNVQFIHPEAHHVLKTRGAGEKRFINICSDQLIDKPSSEAATGRDGKAGYNWRLPFSLTPGRPDRDAAGSRCMIYDVIFHPDALHAAEDSTRLLQLLHSTAIRGIEDAFHIELDTSNIKQLKMKYKGVPQAAVIRRPIPAEQQQSTSDPEPEPGASCAAPPDPEDSRSSSNQPTKPHYTVKYRSVVDLQDYRCSRDSGPGARPREIIITVDLPLLRSAQDAEVSVQERRLVLESQKPAYKLDLPLSYPVDEDKGDAKFNKTKKQLTITLPVQPVRSTALHQIRCDEMKGSGEDEDDAADQVPETSACDTAGLQHEPETSFPFASEPQLIDLTTEPQTLVNPAVNRTEPQEPDHLYLICSVEMNNEDGININRPVDSSSNTFSSEAEIQTRVTANGRDEDIHEVSGALETEHTQVFESNTASDANALVPHQPLTTDNNALINQQSSSSANQQLNHEEDRSASQDTEPKTRRSSEDHESTTERLEEPAAANGVIPRETEPDGRHVFICTHKTSAALCFQNSLWSDLDLS
ncbi:protein kintoun [Sinocyclocheilus anshuiensis]|uniref:protein kintoun n=1 Tax=Sinocyclocheilus anshuiensis TaxID=1608454 RepID=UPI0007B7EBCD|nr:PREDICTED: protein kintoun [Sinocyclocheilus anshuiensis]